MARARSMGPRAFVEIFLRSRSCLRSVPSSTGGQLAMARNSVKGSLFVRDDCHLYENFHRVADKYQRHAWLSVIWRSLTVEERDLIKAKHTPVDHVRVCCERRLSDLREGDGDVMSLLHDDEGNLTGYAKVMEIEPEYPTNEDLARMFGLSLRAVRSRVEAAYGKIRRHRLLPLIAADYAGAELSEDLLALARAC